MAKYIHRLFGTLEVVEEPSERFILNGDAVLRDVAFDWLEKVRAFEERRDRMRWERLARENCQVVSWWRYPIARWKLERIYRQAVRDTDRITPVAPLDG